MCAGGGGVWRGTLSPSKSTALSWTYPGSPGLSALASKVAFMASLARRSSSSLTRFKSSGTSESGTTLPPTPSSPAPPPPLSGLAPPAAAPATPSRPGPLLPTPPPPAPPSPSPPLLPGGLLWDVSGRSDRESISDTSDADSSNGAGRVTAAGGGAAGRGGSGGGALPNLALPSAWAGGLDPRALPGASEPVPQVWHDCAGGGDGGDPCFPDGPDEPSPDGGLLACRCSIKRATSRATCAQPAGAQPPMSAWCGSACAQFRSRAGWARERWDGAPGIERQS
eukprot:scaffold12239_cov111-Isochrysis_galbana.AAC.1